MPDARKPSLFTAKVINKSEISPKNTKLELEANIFDFSFIPGQFVNIKASDTAFRSYSICSDTRILPKFTLVIETAHEGIGSNYVKSLKTGDEVTLVGPSGKLNLPENLPSSLYFIATGTGITPFMSMFYQLSQTHYTGNVKLLFGIRREIEMFFVEELEQLKKEIPNFSVSIYVSQPEKPENQPQRVTAVLSDLTDPSAHYFLCGHPQMVEEIQKGLLENGIPQENIIKEEFTRPKQTGTV